MIVEDQSSIQKKRCNGCARSGTILRLAADILPYPPPQIVDRPLLCWSGSTSCHPPAGSQADPKVGHKRLTTTTSLRPPSLLTLEFICADNHVAGSIAAAGHLTWVSPLLPVAATTSHRGRPGTGLTSPHERRRQHGWLWPRSQPGRSLGAMGYALATCGLAAAAPERDARRGCARHAGIRPGPPHPRWRHCPHCGERRTPDGIANRVGATGDLHGRRQS
jgi:hypothetical protein